MNPLRSIRSDPDRPDRRTATIFVTAAACLWSARFAQDLVPATWSRLGQLNWWAGTQIVFYGLVPLIVGAFVGLGPRDLGWRTKGTLSHGLVYAGLLVVAVPFVVVASRSTDFQEHYPLLDVVRGQHGVWNELASWWPFYAVQFVAIEVFFRGFLVLGLSNRFGSSSVLIAVVPYMMIHFVKPPAEAAASVIGGVVLGYLALRTRSIIWGIGLHIAVAASMDIASLVHKGFLW